MRFGVLGDAKIAREKLYSAITSSGHEVSMIGRRDPSLGANKVWSQIPVGTYEDVINNSNVDIVYNPLPNHLHVEMTIRALQAGKPVLCEKPIAISEKELDRLEETIEQTQLYVYDGFMIRYHPQWDWIRSINVGQRKIIHSHFTYSPQPIDNVRNFKEYGGGPLWDIGGYCILAGLLIFGGTPTLVASKKIIEEKLDVEIMGTGLIEFGHEQILNFTVSSGASLSQHVSLIGTHGWASLDVPFNPPKRAKARFASKSDGKDAQLSFGKEVTFEECDQYSLMIRDFVKAVKENRKTNLSESRYITRILDQMLLSNEN